MNKDLLAIFEYLEREKGIRRDVIVSAIEESLLTAAYKSVQGLIRIRVHVNPKTGDIAVVAQKEIVDHVTIPEEELSLEEAHLLHPDTEFQLGQWVDIPCTPSDFGRVAAQVARQVIAQKLRTAEKDVIHEEYRHRMHEVISGTVKKIVRGSTLIVDLGKVEGILPDHFYPKTETYNVGDRVQALLWEVRETPPGGADVVLTPRHPEFVKQLFKMEVPELQDGTIKVKMIVRDAGYRTKMVVESSDDKIDPVGSCVGVRGTRVKNIIREVNEKIDIIPYVADPIQLLLRALSPIEPRKIEVSEDGQVYSVVVPDESYAIALGKRGMNARLNGQLLGEGVELQVQKASDYQQLAAIQRQQLALMEDPALDEKLAIGGMSSLIVATLVSAGYDTPRKLLKTTVTELAKIPEISEDLAMKILDDVYNKKKGLNIG